MDTLSLTTGTRFARALDDDDFDAAQALLAPHCEYLARQGLLRGTATIIDAYRQASAWARSVLDGVAYRSTVRASDPGQAVIRFVDDITHRGTRHVYACEQDVHVSGAGLITRIVHRELPGEREAVEAFLAAAGVVRAPSAPGADG